MKFLLSIAMLALAACTQSGTAPLPAAIQSVVPAKYDINAPAFAGQKEEIQEAVETCGAGVVKGAAGGNKCAFQINLEDDQFWVHQTEKTGLMEDEEWAYRDDVSFVEASEDEALPDNFDLRDLMKNGQPEMKRQMCGDCWAWATHHGYELVQAVHDQKVVDNSSQAVLSCSGKGSCRGGYMSAVDYLKNGLPLESEFPYKNGVTGSCKYSKAEQDWEPKVIATPYVGDSRRFSRSLKYGGFAARPSVQQMKAAMYKWKAPLVVTVASYSISGDGVYDRCSAVNSGGNHMVAIVGWEKWNGKDVAHVWNSHGKGHGKNGVSRIVWECNGGLNRGLGVAAKVIQYKPACQPPVVEIGAAKHVILAGTSVKLGKASPGQTCKWSPEAGLSDANSCETYASPGSTTEYHLEAKNDCGTASAMTLIEVWGPNGKSPVAITPNGLASY